MSNKQMLIIIIALLVVEIALTVQIGEDHISRADVTGIIGFMSGAAFVVALHKGGKK